MDANAAHKLGPMHRPGPRPRAGGSRTVSLALTTLVANRKKEKNTPRQGIKQRTEARKKDKRGGQRKKRQKKRRGTGRGMHFEEDDDDDDEKEIEHASAIDEDGSTISEREEKRSKGLLGRFLLSALVATPSLFASACVALSEDALLFCAPAHEGGASATGFPSSRCGQPTGGPKLAFPLPPFFGPAPFLFPPFPAGLLCLATAHQRRVAVSRTVRLHGDSAAGRRRDAPVHRVFVPPTRRARAPPGYPSSAVRCSPHATSARSRLPGGWCHRFAIRSGKRWDAGADRRTFAAATRRAARRVPAGLPFVALSGQAVTRASVRDRVVGSRDRLRVDARAVAADPVVVACARCRLGGDVIDARTPSTPCRAMRFTAVDGFAKAASCSWDPPRPYRSQQRVLERSHIRVRDKMMCTSACNPSEALLCAQVIKEATT